MRSAYAHSSGGRPIYAHGWGVAGVAPEGAVPRWFWPPTFESAAFVLLGRRPTPGLGRSAALGRSSHSRWPSALGPEGWDRPGSELWLEEPLATRPDSVLQPATSPVALLV